MIGVAPPAVAAALNRPARPAERLRREEPEPVNTAAPQELAPETPSVDALKAALADESPASSEVPSPFAAGQQRSDASDISSIEEEVTASYDVNQLSGALPPKTFESTVPTPRSRTAEEIDTMRPEPLESEPAITAPAEGSDVSLEPTPEPQAEPEVEPPPPKNDSPSAEQRAESPGQAAASSTSSAVFPSRVPPPLIHDPRANVAPPRTDAGGASRPRTRYLRGVLVGGATALVVVGGGIALALWYLSSRGLLDPESPTRVATAELAPVAASAVLPAAAAEDAGADAGTDAAAKADARPAPAEAGADADAGDAAARASAAAAPKPPRRVYRPRRRAPVRRRAPAKQQPKRYVPDDI